MQLQAAGILLCKKCIRAARRGISVSTAWSRSSENYYDVLGVKQEASLDEIKQAFFKRSRKLHPDSDPSNPGLHSRFVSLSEAYQVLSKESSRRQYDATLRLRPASGSGSRGDPYTYPSPHSPGSAGSRYWEQFGPAPSEGLDPALADRKRRRNLQLVGCCVLVMLASLGVHYFGFRKLEEAHNSFMDEKDRVITEIYKESKERARMNGLKKQQEILRQKHAEFVEKYRNRSDK
ncbi:dnaJ homolog subfamily C member 4-like isoform X1 [Acipenser ruthenus]|uniref:dnaJ homolog subfamily C member 4-like isoform X1 n=1 Tax=Acipenser ruthenus TaxID=7906 RepID=UPI002741AAB2|nr:dnaJ homolog subfamily C member 4-like isoform X1 [Acipenser ruthenus]